MSVQNPECGDSQKEDIPSGQYERKLSKNVNFQTPEQPFQKKITSPNLCKFDSQGQTYLSTKSPMKNGIQQAKLFKEDSSLCNQEKESPQKLRKKSSFIQQTIELTFQKQQPQNFSQCYKNTEEAKKRFSQLEYDEQSQCQQQEMNQTEQAEQIKNCKLCADSEKQKERTENTERDEDVEDEEEDGENESESIQDEENKKKKNNSNDLIQICRCPIMCWAHKRCLINQTVNNKFKCRFCNTLSTFKTKRNRDFKIIKANYAHRKKEVKSIFYLFGITILILFGYLIYFIRTVISQEETIIIQIFSLISLILLAIYGFVFFFNNLDKLCITEIDSDIQFEDLIPKKKETQTLNTQKITEGNENNYINNNNLFTQMDEIMYQQQEMQNNYQSNNEKKLFKKFISPNMNSFNSQEQKQLQLKRSLTQRSNYSQVNTNNTNRKSQIPLMNQFQQQRRNFQRSSTAGTQTAQMNRILFTDESEQQSPNDRRIQNNLGKFTQKNCGSIHKNSSSSNNKTNSNENHIRNYNTNNNKSQQITETPFSERYKKVNQKNLPNSIDQEAINKTIKQTEKLHHEGENESPFTKIQQLQQESHKQVEQTSRFGEFNGSSTKNKQSIIQPKYKNNQKTQKYILQNFQKLKKPFYQYNINDINEESHNSSSINNSNNLKTKINEGENDIENQQSKPSLITSPKSSSDENRKSTEDNIHQSFQNQN